MKSVAGIFPSRDAAERAARRLASSGFSRDHLTLLTPGTDARRLASVPIDEGEAPGTGAAIGAVTGIAAGAGVGLPIGAAVSVVVPGIGPIIAFGLLGAALFGAGGAAIGNALENTLTQGVPRDDLFVYEEASRSSLRSSPTRRRHCARGRPLPTRGRSISTRHAIAGGAPCRRPSAAVSTRWKSMRTAAGSRRRSGATTARTFGRCTATSSISRRSSAGSSGGTTIATRARYAVARDGSGGRLIGVFSQTPGR